MRVILAAMTVGQQAPIMLHRKRYLLITAPLAAATVSVMACLAALFLYDLGSRLLRELETLQWDFWQRHASRTCGFGLEDKLAGEVLDHVLRGNWRTVDAWLGLAFSSSAPSTRMLHGSRESVSAMRFTVADNRPFMKGGVPGCTCRASTRPRHQVSICRRPVLLQCSQPSPLQRRHSRVGRKTRPIPRSGIGCLHQSCRCHKSGSASG